MSKKTEKYIDIFINKYAAIIGAIFISIFFCIFINMIAGNITCNDSWVSLSIGERGACSHHSGVESRNWIIIFAIIVFYVHWKKISLQITNRNIRKLKTLLVNDNEQNYLMKKIKENYEELQKDLKMGLLLFYFLGPLICVIIDGNNRSQGIILFLLSWNLFFFYLTLEVLENKTLSKIVNFFSYWGIFLLAILYTIPKHFYKDNFEVLLAIVITNFLINYLIMNKKEKK